MREFLSDEDLRTLTGYVRTCKQIEYLKREGIPYRLNAKGKLVVSRNLASKPLPDFELGPVA
jgi:biotin operon repressor